jgi:hypothetical protein
MLGPLNPQEADETPRKNGREEYRDDNHDSRRVEDVSRGNDEGEDCAE